MDAAHAKRNDLLTVVAIAALAYIVAVFIHEIIGHGMTTLALGGAVKEYGAYYVDPDTATLSATALRLVALGGPISSALTGMVAWLVLRQLDASRPRAQFFTWLLGTLGWLSATGYLLFSGAGGIGDLGFDESGALYHATPQWLWRVLLFGVGAAAYYGSAVMAVRRFETIDGGSGRPRIRRARILALQAYLTGGIVAVLIGLLNPQGIIIVLVSAIASTFGGSSALLWMMQLLNRTGPAEPAPLLIQRSWAWIAVALLVVGVFAAVLGPTVIAGAAPGYLWHTI